MISLRSPNCQCSRLDVVLPERLRESRFGGVSRNKRIIVRLVLITFHVHLVALTVIDEHMKTFAVSHHLEIAGVLVHVQDHVELLLFNERFDVRHLRHICHIKAALAHELARPRGVTRKHHHGPGFRQFLERRIPLAHLVKVHITIGEVHSDSKMVWLQRAACVEHAFEVKERASSLQYAPCQFDGPPTVLHDLHEPHISVSNLRFPWRNRRYGKIVMWIVIFVLSTPASPHFPRLRR